MLLSRFSCKWRSLEPKSHANVDQVDGNAAFVPCLGSMSIYPTSRSHFLHLHRYPALHAIRTHIDQYHVRTSISFIYTMRYSHLCLPVLLNSLC
jgi:hypothetical protein